VRVPVASDFAGAKELLQSAVSFGGIKITKNNKASTHQQNYGTAILKGFQS
jgi:hypothetical protein